MRWLNSKADARSGGVAKRFIETDEQGKEVGRRSTPRSLIGDCLRRGGGRGGARTPPGEESGEVGWRARTLRSRLGLPFG